MNKVSLLTTGRKLQDGNLYLMSIYDLEPSGLVVHAYDQLQSKEYVLPVSEVELLQSGISRTTANLTTLLDSIDILPQGEKFVLESSIEHISKIKKRPLAAELDAVVRDPIPGCDESINDVLVAGLIELCRVKPVGLDAVQWLGEWLLNNNPNKPLVIEPDE